VSGLPDPARGGDRDADPEPDVQAFVLALTDAAERLIEASKAGRA